MHRFFDLYACCCAGLVAAVAAALLLGIPSPTARAADAIRLDQAFDSGSLDTQSSSVELQDQRLRVTIAPRRTWDNRHWWVHFRIRGVQGKTPEFRAPVARSFYPINGNHRYVFSYDQQTWHYFDRARIEGSQYVFSHDRPFRHDTAYVAFGLPYPMSRVAEYTEAIRSRSYVFPTASADRKLVIGWTPGTAGGGYVDDRGRAVESQPLFGYQITDAPDGSREKTTIVVIGGNHSGETLDGYILEGMVDTLLGDEQAARWLRQHARFFIYPNVNPEGRAAGYFRSSPEHPDKDHNRFWTDTTVADEGPSPLTTIRLVTEAIRTDTAQAGATGAVDVFFDLHSGWNRAMLEDPQPQNSIWHITNLGGDQTPFHQALTVRQQGIWASPRRPKHPHTAGSWAARVLRATEVITPEPGFGQPADYYHAIGRNYILALADSLGG